MVRNGIVGISTIEENGKKSTPGKHGKPMKACKVCEGMLKEPGMTDCAGE